MTHANYLHLQKEELTNFWKQLGGRQSNGKGYNEDEKLIALISLAKIVYFRRGKSLPRYRKNFNQNYKSLWKLPCFICQNQSHHRHHLIPLVNGGINCKINRLPLCRDCHPKIHPWLTSTPTTASVFSSS